MTSTAEPSPQASEGAEGHVVALLCAADLEAEALPAVLATHAALTLVDSRTQVRRGQGVVAVLPLASARGLQLDLARLGVATFRLAEPDWPLPPRPVPVQSVLRTDESLLLDIGRGEPLHIPRTNLQSFRLRAMLEKKYAVRPGQVRGLPAELPVAERDLLEAVAAFEHATGKTEREGAMGRGLDFLIDLLCWEPPAAFVLRRSHLSYSSADQDGSHGLLNFLALAKNLRALMPEGRVESLSEVFLESLELQPIVERGSDLRRAHANWAFARMLHDKIGLGERVGP